MTGNQHEPLGRLIEEALSQIDELLRPPEPAPTPQDQPGTGQAFPGTINIFVAEAPADVEEDDQLPDTPPTIESTLTTSTAAEESRHHEAVPSGEKVSGQPGQPAGKLHRQWRTVVAFALVVFLALLFALLTLVDPLFQPEATITVIPASRTVTATLPVTLTLGTGKGSLPPGSAAVQGRRLPQLSLSQAVSVPTSGTGHQEAQAARGTITFYNALPLVQTIPAGTLVIGTDGTQVVIDQDAVIPAGNGATNGEAIVPAHTLVTGPAGNIAALDINGPCCRAYVLAKNTAAFTGGTDARNFPMVSASDIEHAASALKASLDASVQAALSAQVQAGETLLAPVPCTPSVTSSKPAGAEAVNIIVTVQETCQGIAYQSAAMQHRVDAALAEQAVRTLGTGYAPEGTATITVVSTKAGTGDTLRLVMQDTETWVYAFDGDELMHLREMAAGKPKAEAAMLLLQAPGVRQVVFGDSVGETLPADPERIQIAVLYQ